MKNKTSDGEISKKFNDFYEKEWDPEMAYTPSDFIVMFGIDRHLSRYYLMDMVYEKRLFRMKYNNKTAYIKYNEVYIDKFKEFTWLKVVVT